MDDLVFEFLRRDAILSLVSANSGHLPSEFGQKNHRPVRGFFSTILQRMKIDQHFIGLERKFLFLSYIA
jgi:hypothetical protein